eukprot:377761_1
MNESELGPSSVSTLEFTPDYVKVLLSDSDTESEVEEQKVNRNKPQRTNKYEIYNSSMNIYSLRSKSSNRRSINRKAMSDHETMAFVAMRDVLNIHPNDLAKLYNYNKREYDTFQAVLNNKNVNYKNWINSDEVTILYYLFSRISDKNAFIQIWSDLGYDHFFDTKHAKELFISIRNLEIRAKDGQLFELQFFMKLLIFFWDNLSEIDIETSDMGGIHDIDAEQSTFTHFWAQSLSKTIQFISDLNVGINIEIYCLSKYKWINATIIDTNKNNKQIHIQYLDGSNKHEWIYVYSNRIAPITFQYLYTPNMNKRNNVPCIVSIIDSKLNDLGLKHVKERNMIEHIKPNVVKDASAFYYIPPSENKNVQNIIPKEGWFFKSSANKQIGPVSIGMLFKACVTREIDDNSIIYHQEFGTTKLNKLPHIINVFRIHVKKCKQYIDSQTKSVTTSRQTSDLSTHTSSNFSLRNFNISNRNQ